MNEIKHMICPITYEPLQEGEKYSKKGLKLLSPKLLLLKDLPFSAKEQRMEAQQRADKMSIQGVQPKLSAILDLNKQSFEICDVGGKFILKPPNEYYEELPENEDLSMRLAASMIEVPLHGLIYSIDGSLTYFIKRFDRLLKDQKLAVEDFSQLSGATRDTKYQSSMEKIIPIIEKNCTFPAIEKLKLFTRTVFNYLIGNEDMHLKNFSLITRESKVELAPAYDFINTTIVLQNIKEEIALPLKGKKNNLSKNDIVKYYGMEKLNLNNRIINETLERFSEEILKWKKLIASSFLSEKNKKKYLEVLEKRIKILCLS